MPFHVRSYRSRVIIRIITLALLMFAGFYLALETDYWLVVSWIGLFIVLGVIDLIRLHERSNRVFNEFLLSIQQEDFSSENIKSEFHGELKEAYHLIIEKFRGLRAEKETHYHYLQRIIEQVDTALICFDQEEKIQLLNRSAKELLEVGEIKWLRAIAQTDPRLIHTIRSIKSGQRELVRLLKKGKILNLLIRGSEFTLEGMAYKIVSLQDIKSELDEQEVDSWQRLVRVLTHEIMNSTIPITNMVSFAREFLVDDKGKPKRIPGLDQEEIEDLMMSLATAESRGKGLVKFVRTTKDLARIPEPSFREVEMKYLFKRVKGLYKQEMKSKEIELTVGLEDGELILNADLELIEQVLINLVKNAMEALSETEDPKIVLSAIKRDDGSICIKVEDNGPGIPDEILDQIFIPFYSTKKEGSGVGLALTRQIMKLHKGRIEVHSELGKGTVFTLEF